MTHKFHYKDTVKVTTGFYRGQTGQIEEYDSYKNFYIVKCPKFDGKYIKIEVFSSQLEHIENYKYLQKLEPYDYKLSNKKWEELIKMVWDKLNELIEEINILKTQMKEINND